MLRGVAIAALALAVAGVPVGAEAGKSKKRTRSKKPSCLKTLDELGVKYSRTKRRHIRRAVRVRGPLGGVTYESYRKKPLVMDCSLAVSLAVAGRFLVAHGIDSATYSSAYHVRNVRGTRRRSRHSYGLAIDVHSFSGPDVGTLHVKDDYEQGLGDEVDCIGRPLTQGGAILRALRCQMDRSGLFHNILDPDYDGDHWNHFHLSVHHWREREDDPLVWERRDAQPEGEDADRPRRSAQR